jgi:hypothetical protein
MLTTRITNTEIQHFRVTSPNKIEIELRTPINRSFFDLQFDFHITGASSVSCEATVLAAAAAGKGEATANCLEVLEASSKDRLETTFEPNRFSLR